MRVNILFIVRHLISIHGRRIKYNNLKEPDYFTAKLPLPVDIAASIELIWTG